MIPELIKSKLKEQTGLTISEFREVHGGSINRASKVSTGRGDYFLKWNHNAPEHLFEKEAEGLDTLRKARHSLIIPEVIALGKIEHSGHSFLLMDNIEPADSGDSFRFGAELAGLHKNNAEQFGFQSDNYVGSLPQHNRFHSTWTDFFVTERMEPQLSMAVDAGKLPVSIRQNWERLSSRLDDIFPVCKPSLLHGDLWGGNYLFNGSGNAVLIDPAVYYGHPEVDLAFSTMFGGFTYDFYEGYESVSPLEPGFDERVPIYNLYPLLVHVNLFGGAYINSFVDIIKTF